jgi:hypothetical protein
MTVTGGNGTEITFDPKTASAALGEDRAPSLKGLTVVNGPNGEPKLMYFGQDADGKGFIEETGFEDFDAGQRAAGGAGSKTTTAEREAASDSLFINQAQAVFTELDEAGSYFTGVGDLIEKGFTNNMKPEELQKFEQATANFVQTYLRDVSGATIKGEEIVLDTTRFIPQFGDSRAMVMQKADNRRAYQAGLMAKAGNTAYQEAQRIYGVLTNHATYNSRLDQTGLN